LQELEETSYWLELLVESGIVPAARLEDLIDEAKQLVDIFVTCVKRAKSFQSG
jgi:four helix bundle protein